MNFNFFKFYLNKFLSLNIYLRGSITKNDVTLSRFIDASGIQRLFPINVDRMKQFTLGLNMNKDFKRNEKFKLTLGLSPYLSYTQVPILINDISSKSATIELGPKMLLGFNYNDVVEFRPSYSLVLNKTSYSNNKFPDLQVITQNLQADLLVYWPWKIIWQSNVFLRHNSEVAPGLPRKSVLWNVAAAVPVLKKGRGQLKLSVYDLLNQNNNFSRYTRENLIVDQQINVLTRYGLATLTYNFQNVGGSRQVSERRRLFLF
jgi:hypothetical protein